MNHYKFLYKDERIVGAVARTEDQAINRLRACFDYQHRIRHRVPEYGRLEPTAVYPVTRIDYFKKDKIRIREEYADKRKKLLKVRDEN